MPEKIRTLLKQKVITLAEKRGSELSYNDIAREVSTLSTEGVKSVLRRHNIKKAPKIGGKKNLRDLTSISQEHRIVGSIIADYVELEQQLSINEARELFGFPLGTFSKMFRGCHNFTLEEIQKIGKVTGKSITEMLTVPKSLEGRLRLGSQSDDN